MTKYTVRCWVKVNGEYQPMTPEQMKPMGPEIVRRMGEAIQDHYNQHPEEYSA